MSRRRRFWLIGIGVVITVGIAYGIYVLTSADTVTADEETPLQTSTARRGNITLSATAAGLIIPATEITIGFPANGIVSEILVDVGDNVNASDVLARLDDSDAQQTLLNAQLQLTQAAMKSNAEATETGKSIDDISIEQAQLNLDQAQAALEDLLSWEPDEDEIARLEASLAAAQASYNAALGQEASKGYSNQVSKISLEQAERDLAAAQDNYNAAWDEARDWETFWNQPICDPGEPQPCTGQTWAERIERDRESTANALVRAQDNLAIAQANYSSAVSGSSNSNSVGAHSNVVNAEIALQEALSGPGEDEIETAEIAVRQAELNLQQALLNRESNVLTFAQAQLNVEGAEAAVSETELVAPIDGTVMTINAAVGESAGADFLVLADLEQPLLEVFLDETDMSLVGVGFEADIVFDALPENTFTGKVIRVDPQLVNSGGVSAVRAEVLLDADSFVKPQTLPVGMNATVDIIGGRAENAVLVPVEAVRELSAGQYAVFVMEDDEPKLRFVEVGLMDFTFAEITSGLEPGEIVTTGIVDTD